MLTSLACLLVLAAAPGDPDWSKEEVKRLFALAEAAGQSPSEPALMDAMANAAGSAYKVTRLAGEPVSTYARRIVKKREPTHPTVIDAHWVRAASRLFYEDLGKRAATLARFELDKRDSAYLEQHAQQAKAAANAWAEGIQTKVEGVEGFMEPLPISAEGDPPTQYGARVIVRQGRITIEDMERMRFEGDRPSEKAERTASGALRELYSALKQYNMSAEIMSRIDPMLKKGAAQLRLFLPATAPGVYLNELVRAGKEGKMKTVYLMVTSKTDASLEQIVLTLDKAAPAKPKKGKAKPAPEPVDVRCADDELLQKCVDRFAAHLAEGPLHLVLQ